MKLYKNRQRSLLGEGTRYVVEDVSGREWASSLSPPPTYIPPQ